MVLVDGVDVTAAIRTPQIDRAVGPVASNAEVRAAGFPATSRATTIPGIDYQFFTKPRIHRTGGYDNLFPSASFKYMLNPSLSFHAGYSSTIRRPQISQVAGAHRMRYVVGFFESPVQA